MSKYIHYQCINSSWPSDATWRQTSLSTWWRHQMETFSALLAICAGNSPVPGEFLAQRPVTRSFHVFFDLRLTKPWSKQSWGWWFRCYCAHCDVIVINIDCGYGILVSIGSGNGLVPNTQQAITWTIDNSYHWRIYVLRIFVYNWDISFHFIRKD